MKKLAVIIIIAIMSMSLNAVYGANIDTQIKQQEKNRKNMKDKIKQYNAIAKEKSKQTQTLLGQLTKLRKEASDSQNQMQNLEQKNNKLQRSVNELNARIKTVNETKAKIINMLKRRLPELYKYTPDERQLNLILNSSGAHDAVNTSYMLRLFARQDEMMLAELLRQENELQKAKRELEADKTQIRKQTEEIKKRRAEYDTTIKKTDSLLKNVQKEEKQALAAAKELENAQRAVGSKINSLMNQKKTAQSKKSTSSKTSASKSASSKSSTSSKTAQKAPATANTSTVATRAPGALSWPVNGTVTMQYGSRVHPVFKTKIFNSGIDIKASAGAPVKAAGSGEVLYQGWLRGFGQVVIIDHGGDLSTVYAHLGGASVREGSAVKSGSVIGKVGNTGTDSEYGLHFEVRKNGKAVNPMSYLR